MNPGINFQLDHFVKVYQLPHFRCEQYVQIEPENKKEPFRSFLENIYLENFKIVMKFLSGDN